MTFLLGFMVGAAASVYYGSLWQLNATAARFYHRRLCKRCRSLYAPAPMPRNTQGDAT